MLGSAFLRGFGRWALRLIGWRLTGSVPNNPKVLFALAPHTSNWDWVIGMFALLGVGFKATYLAKHSLFFWPLGNLIRATGGVPINRADPRDTVDRIVDEFNRQAVLYYGLAPEGTRKKVVRWKTGFLRIAQRSGAALLLVSMDYPSKTIHIGPEFKPSGDLERDLDEIMQYFRAFQGRNPHLQS